MNTKENKSSLVGERTLKTLLLFTEYTSLKVNDISKHLAISLTSAYRIIYALENTGFIKKNELKEYHLLSTNIFQLYKMIDTSLEKTSKPIIKSIVQNLKESVYLSILEGEKNYKFIQYEDSPYQLKWSENIGELRPMPAGTAGKTHLAFMIENESEIIKKEMISDLNIVPYTKNTIVDENVLISSLEQIVKQGFSFTRSEHVNGVVGLSVPVYDFNRNNVVAVLSVFMVESRFNTEEKEKYVEYLKQGAEQISNNI